MNRQGVLAAAVVMTACAPTQNAFTPPPLVRAQYECAGGGGFDVAFDNRANTATLSRDGVAFARLEGQRAASGIWYRGGGYDLRGKGDEATLTATGRPDLICRSRS